MTTTTLRIPKFAAAACLAALLAAALPSTEVRAQDAGATPPAAPGETKFERRGLRRGAGARRAVRHRAMRHRNAARAEIGRALALTDDQRRVILEKARAAEPIVAQWRRDLAREFVARETTPQADRTARRAAHRALREKLAADLAPLAKEVVATLTPEQRARLEGFAAARGRKLTDDALVAFVSRMLARPMTVPLLEARLGTR